MGELSKKIGDAGEKAVKGLFSHLGWSPLIDGATVVCSNGRKHKRDESSSDRKDHGVDLIFAYICSHDPGTRKHVLISVKNQFRESKETAVNRSPGKIKNDLTDLDTAMECFVGSELYNEQNSHGGASRSEVIGVLVYLDMNPENGDKRDSQIGLMQLKGFNRHPINILDYQRFDFLESCWKHLKIKYPNQEAEFYVPNSSPSVISNTTRRIPVFSITGGPVLYSVTYFEESGSSRKKLVVFVEELFSKDLLKNYLALAFKTTGEWTTAEILFPDYNEAKDGPVATALVQSLPQDKEFLQITCASYSPLTRTH